MVRTMPSRTHAPRVTALLLAITLGLAPTLALAGDAKVAIKFYEDAQVAYGNGEYDRAAELLFQAYQEDPNLVYQYNRVLALQAAGKLELALDTLNTFYPLMRDDPQKRFEDIAEIRTSLEEAIAARKAQPEPKTDPKPDPTTPDPVVTPPPTEPVEEGGNDILAWSLIGVGVVALGVGTLYITGTMLPELPCETFTGRRVYIDAHGRMATCCQLSDYGFNETEVVADLNLTSFADAFALYERRLKALRRASRPVGGDPLDPYPCMRCAKASGKLDWLRGYGATDWGRMVASQPRGRVLPVLR